MRASIIGGERLDTDDPLFPEQQQRRRRAARLVDLSRHPAWSDYLGIVAEEIDALTAEILKGRLPPTDYAAYTHRRIGLLEAVNLPSKEAQATGIPYDQEPAE